MKRSTFFSIVFVIVIAIVTLFTACDENTRKQLDLDEPQRTVVLMDNNGDTIKKWEGNFYVHTCENGVIYFYVDGKKTIINGGIFISEENK